MRASRKHYRRAEQGAQLGAASRMKANVSALQCATVARLHFGYTMVAEEEAPCRHLGATGTRAFACAQRCCHADDLDPCSVGGRGARGKQTRWRAACEVPGEAR